MRKYLKVWPLVGILGRLQQSFLACENLGTLRYHKIPTLIRLLNYILCMKDVIAEITRAADEPNVLFFCVSSHNVTVFGNEGAAVCVGILQTCKHRVP